jgi:hypothetical protein
MSGTDLQQDQPVDIRINIVDVQVPDDPFNECFRRAAEGQCVAQLMNIVVTGASIQEVINESARLHPHFAGWNLFSKGTNNHVYRMFIHPHNADTVVMRCDKPTKIVKFSSAEAGFTTVNASGQHEIRFRDDLLQLIYETSMADVRW